MEKFFHLKENGTTVSTEILAGLTTFFAMAYIIVVNPQILSQTGMPWGGVFLATIIAAIIGTLVMGLFANVPYAQAAGMGLNAFFTYTVCFGLGFSWQQTMCMVFLCGLINILITVTKIRKMIILAIPESLQHAIGGGIGLFVAYVGMLNVGLIKFTPGDPKAAAKGGAVAATPGLANFNDKVLWVFLIGLVLAIVFTVMKVKGGMLLAIAITTVIGIPFGVTTWSNSQSISETFSQLPQTFGAIFSAEGFPALFSDPTKLPLVIVTIFAFSMSDTFDTLGTFIGTGRRTGIFSAEDEKALENGHGFSSKMDKALFADSIATSIGAICYVLNTMCGTTRQALGLEMDAISSAVIGGTLLTGGVGNVFGSFFGVLINGTISSLVKTNGKLSSSWPNVVTALLLCFFIVLQAIFAKVKARRS